MNDRTTKPSQRHHFVPCWYLRHWCEPNGRLLRARKTPSGIHFDDPRPEAVGYENHLNTVFDASGNSGDDVTRLLDDPFSLLHKKMLIAEGLQNLTDTEKLEIARHLCALQVRNPRIIRDQIEPAVARPMMFPSWLSPQELEEMKEHEPRYRKKFNSNYDLSKFTSHAMLPFLDKDAEFLASKE